MNVVVAGHTASVGPTARPPVNITPAPRRPRQPRQKGRLAVALKIHGERESTVPDLSHQPDGMAPRSHQVPPSKSCPIDADHLVDGAKSLQQPDILLGGQERDSCAGKIVPDQMHRRQGQHYIPDRLEPDDENSVWFIHTRMEACPDRIQENRTGW